MLVLAAVALAIAQTSAPTFNGNRAYEDLRQMVAYGPRPAGSAALKETRDYIEKELKAAGLKPEEQPFDAQTPAGTVHMVNVRATVPGQSRGSARLVIGGHYDTKIEKAFPFVGASDAASSAAFLLELARDLKGHVSPLPIELVFLDGEEAVCQDWDECDRPGIPDHTYGSRYYVAQAKRAGTVKDIRAFILVDMIGAKNIIVHREGYSTPWLSDAVWNAAKRLHDGDQFKDDSYKVEDDHLEFLDAGIPSVDIIDLEDYPQWHTAQDDLQHVAAGSMQIVGDVVLSALPE
ncbi:MAG TPA: M28 family peptidase, partial [Vicinamibacterales bacterium]